MDSNDRTALEVAVHLSEDLKEHIASIEELSLDMKDNTDSIQDNTDQIKILATRHRRQRVVIVMLIVTLLTVMKFNYDGNVARCRSGNELREEIDDKWQAVSDFLEVPISADGTDPDEKKFLLILSDNLEQRDCSNINWLGR